MSNEDDDHASIYEVAEVEVEACSVCLLPARSTVAGKLQRCGNCTITRYCGVECQRKDWKAHKPLCKKRTSEAPSQRTEPVSFDSFYDPSKFYRFGATAKDDDDDGDDGVDVNDFMQTMMGDMNKKKVPKSDNEAGFVYFMTCEGYSESLGKCVKCLLKWCTMPLKARFDNFVMPAIEHPYEMMKSKSRFLNQRLEVADASKLVAAGLPERLVSSFTSHFPISPFSGVFARPDDDAISPHFGASPPHPSTYRFPLGGAVEARVGDNEWLAGKVVAHNYREKEWPKGKVAPYQIEVAKGLLFVPTDSSMFVRPSDKYKKDKFEKWAKDQSVWK